MLRRTTCADPPNSRPLSSSSSCTTFPTGNPQSFRTVLLDLKKRSLKEEDLKNSQKKITLKTSKLVLGRNGQLLHTRTHARTPELARSSGCKKEKCISTSRLCWRLPLCAEHKFASAVLRGEARRGEGQVFSVASGKAANFLVLMTLALFTPPLIALHISGR